MFLLVNMNLSLRQRRHSQAVLGNVCGVSDMSRRSCFTLLKVDSTTSDQPS